jgi:hypothetical protein
LKDAYVRYAQTNGQDGAKDRLPLWFADDKEADAWLHGPETPYPRVVARAVEARIHYAGLLGGAANAQAASR